mmetsp:Transcript_362/g.535  ORF Transcript_362/g.535 Transcript_362/m.535 type:complete len:115 (-) Transcript_362:1639-1983(-)
MVIEMPRTDVDVSDPTLGSMSEETIDKQIKNLFEEYVRHKKAYRQAISLSNVSSKLPQSANFENLDSANLSQEERDWNDYRGETDYPISPTRNHQKTPSRTRINSHSRHSKTEV